MIKRKYKLYIKIKNNERNDKNETMDKKNFI